MRFGTNTTKVLAKRMLKYEYMQVAQHAAALDEPLPAQHSNPQLATCVAVQPHLVEDDRVPPKTF